MNSRLNRRQNAPTTPSAGTDDASHLNANTPAQIIVEANDPAEAETAMQALTQPEKSF